LLSSGGIDGEATRGQVPAKTVRHLRSVESWPARPSDAEAGQIQNLRITANVEQDRRIVDCKSVCGYSGSVQFKRQQPAIF